MTVGSTMDRPRETAVTICLGAGGVGKTSLSAALAVAAAEAGERVVVITIDPARRLSEVLGLVEEPLDNEPRLVPGPWTGRLWATTLDPVATFARMLTEVGGPSRARALVSHRRVRVLIESLSGAQEHMAAERLRQLAADGRFDRIVVDTPPARHAVDFLDSPNRLTTFLDNRLFRAVFAARGPRGPLGGVVQLGARLATSLVGATLMTETEALFGLIQGLEDGLRSRAASTAALLAEQRCRYVIIAAARRQPLLDAAWITDSLHRRGREVDCMVINRVTPVDPTIDIEGLSAPLAANLAELGPLAAAEQALVSELRSAVGHSIDVVTVADRPRPPDGIGEIASLADPLRPVLGALRHGPTRAT